ncbi:carbohydrate esterase family 4 protein [Mycena floridula]|nr:carbohydrate esterase family 4 protein [Mycena floridula]
MLVVFLTLVVLPIFVASLHHGHGAHQGHDHGISRKGLPGTWYHQKDHPVHALFQRSTFFAVGSSEWTSSMPAAEWTTPPVSNLPKAWVDVYNAAKARGAIPNIPKSTSVNGDTVYPPGIDPNGKEVCSSYQKCRAPGDHWDAPDKTLGLNFDDGPTEQTTKLVNFLKANNETATHFMIGSNIRDYPDQFRAALDNQDDIGVHTWSHPQLTTLSDLEIISELGYCMQAIHDSTEGRVPRYFRPPTGDADNRVRAIAMQVFGLEIVMWNQDTSDYTMDQNPPATTLDIISGQMHTWLTGSKSPGLIILEHELSDKTVSAFIAAYPVMKSNGWQTESVLRLLSSSAYRNSDGPSGTVVDAGIVDFAGGSGPSAVGGSSSGAAATTSPSQSAKKSSTATSSARSTSSASPSPNVLSNSAFQVQDRPSIWTLIVGACVFLF